MLLAATTLGDRHLAAASMTRGREMTSAIPVISVVGRSNSGKTTLLEKLISELKRRGYRVAAVKHHYHAGFTFDVPGKDSYRFAQAGADHVAVAGPDQVVHMRRWEREPSLAEVVADIRDVDLILTEGYKRERAPKIEVWRRGQGDKGTRGQGDKGTGGQGEEEAGGRRQEAGGKKQDGREGGGGLLCEVEELVAIASDRRFDVDVVQFDLDDVAGLADLVEVRFLRKSIT
jgi:molybdopterin-guanine dinucleotide biosynthesis protein MobB